MKVENGFICTALTLCKFVDLGIYIHTVNNTREYFQIVLLFRRSWVKKKVLHLRRTER